jgi:hypothetical protein
LPSQGIPQKHTSEDQEHPLPWETLSLSLLRMAKIARCHISLCTIPHLSPPGCRPQAGFAWLQPRLTTSLLVSSLMVASTFIS